MSSIPELAQSSSTMPMNCVFMTVFGCFPAQRLGCQIHVCLVAQTVNLIDTLQRQLRPCVPKRHASCGYVKVALPCSRYAAM
jgi:hypothetical protein